MALFKGTSYKRYGNPSIVWSNVYTIDALGIESALTALDDIVDIEKAVHYDSVIFFKQHVQQISDTSIVRSQSGGGAGSLPETGLGGPLPLFCTVRVTFTDGVKRPEIKYLRLPGQEANLTNGAWDGELVDYVQENYADPLVALLAYVGPSGESPTSASVSAAVQNRQLGWHRRGRPGFHRGWVAN